MTRSTSARIILAALILLPAFLLPGCARAPRAAPITPAQRDANLASFDQVWDTIDKKHWDPGHNGVNWDSVRTVLRPEMEAARTQAEADGVLLRMIRSLGQSHFAIVPADVYEEVEGAATGALGEGVTGVDLRVLDGRAIVTSVEPGSPADRAGVRPGWEIARAGDKDVRRVVEKVSSTFDPEIPREMLVTGAVRARLQGQVGEEVRARFLDGAGRARDLVLRLAEPRGSLVTLGDMPSLHVWMDTLRVEPGIGLIRFNMFMDPGRLMETMNAAVTSWKSFDGVIIDLRGNPGGLGGMAMGMAGWFFGEKGSLLGTMTTRETSLKFTVNPRPEPFPGKVAILIDGLSASTSEIMAAGLRDLGRARVFGSRSAGAALPSIFVRLPNGDGFQYAFATYVSQGGTVLERNGVIPDEEVPLTREGLLAGRDAVVDAAVTWITNRRM